MSSNDNSTASVRPAMPSIPSPEVGRGEPKGIWAAEDQELDSQKMERLIGKLHAALDALGVCQGCFYVQFTTADGQSFKNLRRAARKLRISTQELCNRLDEVIDHYTDRLEREVLAPRGIHAEHFFGWARRYAPLEMAEIIHNDIRDGHQEKKASSSWEGLVEQYLDSEGVCDDCMLELS